VDDLESTSLSREEFSNRILATFPRRNYASGSQVLDASHYLVNEQLGRIGEKLNARPDMAQAKPMAEQLRTTDIRLSYGLRSTMPQITLRDGVTKDPFYLLRYVDNADLRPADSPFEVARAKTWFTSLIFQPARFGVTVDLDETLKASQHLFILSRGMTRVYARPGVGGYHVSNLQRQFPWSQRQALYFMLLHGDVYLSRIELGLEMPTPESVTDAEGSPLFIPNQTYLVLWGWTESEAIQKLLHGAGVADWEELYYDWDRLKQSNTPYGMVILEKTTGACFAAYKELLDYVGRQISG
jgi:DEAD/DEAH box helicase domain-containing protein